MANHIHVFPDHKTLTLSSGKVLSPIQIGYETHGTLNADKSNVILLCHGLTGDQHVVTPHPITGKDGWWEKLIGPGRPIDTDKYFVICQNVLGGCMGTTGPKEHNPATGKPWGTDFPVITISDMVNAQNMLLEELGIKHILCVIGGSMGGMQALQWAVSYPHKVGAVIAIATSWHHSAQNIAFHEVGRQAIMSDCDWHNGNYIEHGERPEKGLSVARMIAHITYLSEQALHRKFGRNLQDRPNLSYDFDANFQVESYLRHQGTSFVERFDANSYLYITRAMDYFDLTAEHDGKLFKAFEGSKSRFCIISFSSDWLFPPADSRTIVRALNAVGANVSSVEITTDKGHDAFLLDEPEMEDIIKGFLRSL